MTNTGKVTCTRDTSGAIQVFTVTTAKGDRVWSTADCFPGTGTESRTLAPGESAEYTIKWSGTTSQPDCAGDRVQVPPGDYVLVAALGGLSSKGTPFQITG